MKKENTSKVTMIEIDRINILNPRVRNKKAFNQIVDNIAQVGLKRPITVTPCLSGTTGKEYDLVCGQGRLEAFLSCGQRPEKKEHLQQKRDIQLGFDAEILSLEIGKIMPIKTISERVRGSRRYQQIVVSIREVGIIEPPVVTPSPHMKGR